MCSFNKHMCFSLKPPTFFRFLIFLSVSGSPEVDWEIVFRGVLCGVGTGAISGLLSILASCRKYFQELSFQKWNHWSISTNIAFYKTKYDVHAKLISFIQLWFLRSLILRPRHINQWVERCPHECLETRIYTLGLFFFFLIWKVVVYIPRLQELPADSLGYLEAPVEDSVLGGGYESVLPLFYSISLGGFMSWDKGYLTLIIKILSTLLGSLLLKYTQSWFLS